MTGDRRGPEAASADWRPTADFAALRLRAALNTRLRSYFAGHGVIEVETPVMSVAGNTEPNIASFTVEFSGRSDGSPPARWLRTSPEYPLKRLLAAGFGDCYELGRVFRNGEAGSRHNPEFTMLEWYRIGWDHRRLAVETAAVINLGLDLVGRHAPLVHVRYRDLYFDRLGLDPLTVSDETLRNALGEGVVMDPRGLVRDDWLDLLMTHRLQPGFDESAMLAVHDYPASQSALARLRADRDGTPVAERFELYLGALELANGYHELTDAGEQGGRFERDGRIRQSRADTVPPTDQRLLAALEHGLPDCAGVALGVDRLMMAMLDTERIADVVAFDFFRA